MNDLRKTGALLCAMDGCSGFESEVRETIRSMVSNYAERVITDPLGSLLVFVRGEKRRKEPVVLCAHTDEVGAIVFRISKEGLLYIRPVGYMDPRIFLGKRVHVGEKHIPGVIGCKAIQLCSAAEKLRAPGMTEIYVDIGARDKEDALRYVNIGDQVAFEGESVFFGNDHFMAKAIDDRLLCAILVELLKKPLEYDTWFAFTHGEEDGLRGAFAMTERLKPKYAMVLEGTTAADFPGVKPHLCSTRQGKGAVISLVDRGTMYNETVMRRMTAAGDAKGIPWQYRTTINGRTDSGGINIRNGGTLTFGASIPTRYGHSQVSHVCWSDVEAVAAFAELFVRETGVWEDD